MSAFPTFLFVLLCLSMHACLARHFVFVKVGGKHNIDSSVSDRSSSAVMTPQPKIMNSNDHIVSQSPGQVPAKPLVSVSWRVPAGGEIFKSSSLVVPLKSMYVKGSTRRRGLSVVRFDESNFKKANKNKVQEDAEVIDYDPPHRTPPIHNKKV